LVIFGSGEQTRDFVYIDDVIEALVAASTAPNVDRQVINVGSGIETSLNELVGAIEQVTGREIEPLHSTGQPGGVERMQADLAHAKELLGFVPQANLIEGLRLTLESDPRFAPVVD
jgi:UDP-glucose 4-epimerase